MDTEQYPQVSGGHRERRLLTPVRPAGCLLTGSSPRQLPVESNNPDQLNTLSDTEVTVITVSDEYV